MKFKKFDKAKSRLDLLPEDAIEMVGYVLRHGALKYAPNNWRKCKDPARYVAPIIRHVLKHQKGLFHDKESGLLHLAHATCSALFALDLFIKSKYSKSTMERKQFSYFAIVKRRSVRARSGIVMRRARSYEPLWTYLTDNELDPLTHVIMTVPPTNKVGSTIRI
jgi:hypothetical protein